MNGVDRTLRLLLTAGLLSVGGTVMAAPDWQSLDREQQATLNDFRDRWQDLPPDRRERLLERAERWRSLPVEQREAIQERWREIKPLPPEAREALRQRWESMSPEERRDAARELRRQTGAPGQRMQQSRHQD